MTCSVILSEAKNLSLFVLLYLNRREILRFVQNDSVLSFSAACLACGIWSSRSKNTRACATKCTLLLALLLTTIMALAAPGLWAQQQQVSANPETALSDALSAACRQDSPAFANSLTADNAVAFRAL